MSTGKETGTSDRGRSSPGDGLGASRCVGRGEPGSCGAVCGFLSAAGGGFGGSGWGLAV